MTNLRFKEYVFRHNPARLKVSRCQKVSRSCCYGVGEHLQLLGNGLTVVEGEGELFGVDALEQFCALQKLAGQGAGLLSGAGLEPMQAVLEMPEVRVIAARCKQGTQADELLVKFELECTLADGQLARSVVEWRMNF